MEVNGTEIDIELETPNTETIDFIQAYVIRKENAKGLPFKPTPIDRFAQIDSRVKIPIGRSINTHCWSKTVVKKIGEFDLAIRNNGYGAAYTIGVAYP